ncbi:MAG: azurin [Bacteroidota bacterium]
MSNRISNIYPLVKTFILALFFSLLFGCGGGGETTNSADGSSSTDDNITKLVISGNDGMRFDKEELRVKAGAKVQLTLKHTGQMAKATMGHNVVILKQGTNVNDFATKALRAANQGYVPDGDAVIAHTEMIGGGESSTITFDAPAKGSYDYICTFPGHYSLMKGKLIVE